MQGETGNLGPHSLWVRGFGLTQDMRIWAGSFFLEPEDIKILGLGAIWNFSKFTGLPWFDMGHKGPVKSRSRYFGAEGPQTQMQIYQSINQ